jgi:hypothetical protein
VAEELASLLDGAQTAPSAMSDGRAAEQTPASSAFSG